MRTIHSHPSMKNRSLLLVEDDEALRTTLRKALEARGFTVLEADSVAEGLEVARSSINLAFAVVDMRLQDGSGLEIIDALRHADSQTRAIILTGYGNIPSAVAAINRGAVDFLAKPADADQITSVLLATDSLIGPPPENPPTIEEVRKQHILSVFTQLRGNVSETARRLKMHRRTLQRLMTKYAPG